MFVMLAPVARVDRCKNSTIQSMSGQETTVKIIKKMGPNVMPNPQVGGKFMSGLMSVTRATKTGLNIISDSDPEKLSYSGLKNYLGHFPAGTSFMCINHYRQILLAKRFQKYDHGPEINR